MHPALARAWLTATDPEEQLWLGGKWSPPSIAGCERGISVDWHFSRLQVAARTVSSGTQKIAVAVADAVWAGWLFCRSAMAKLEAERDAALAERDAARAELAATTVSAQRTNCSGGRPKL